MLHHLCTRIIGKLGAREICYDPLRRKAKTERYAVQSMDESNGVPPRDAKRHIELLRGQLEWLASRYHVARIWVFGSYVRGEQRPDSDLDVLVEFSQPPSLIQFIRLEDELSELLGVQVDLVMRSALKPAIGTRILREVVMV
jgi:predicted nucleotidyltransferase